MHIEQPKISDFRNQKDVEVRFTQAVPASLVDKVY